MTMPIVQVDHPRRYPPRVTQFTRPFWDGLREGRFSVTRCSLCARASFPPKPICPHCWTEAVVWEEIATEGTLYSWTRVHAGPAIFDADLPYAIGVVDLDAGVRLATPLMGANVDWQCGMRLELLSCAFTDGHFFAASPKLAFAT
jgi:uncharacterized protein